MSVAGKITVDLEARDARWSDTIQKSEKEVKQFVNNTQNALKDLTFSRGAGHFAETFEKGSKAAEEFATKIRTGHSAAETLGALVDKVPIVGQFKAAGEAIRELVTGEKAAEEQIRKLNASLDITLGSLRAAANIRAGI